MLSLQVGAALSVSLLDQVGAFGTLTIRLAVAAVALALVGRAWRIVPLLRRDPRARRAVLVLGLAMVGLSSTFYLALERLPLGVTVTLELLGPLLLTVLRGRRRRDLACAALALAGVALLTGVTGGLDAPLDPFGVAMALAAGGFWALYILASQAAGSLSSDGAALGVATAVAAVVALPAGALTAGPDLLSPGVLAVGVVVGLLSSAVPYALELRALRTLSAATFGVLMSLEPAAAALAGWVLLSQPLHGVQLVGLAVVVLASSVASLPGRSGTAGPDSCGDRSRPRRPRPSFARRPTLVAPRPVDRPDGAGSGSEPGDPGLAGGDPRTAAGRATGA